MREFFIEESLSVETIIVRLLAFGDSDDDDVDDDDVRVVPVTCGPLSRSNDSCCKYINLYYYRINGLRCH